MPKALRSSLWVASVLWLGAVLALSATEYVSKRQGYFVRQVLPLGTSWQGYQMAFPGRAPITITEEERLCRNERFAELDRQGGENVLHPKESPWACIKSAPVQMSVRWPQFYLALVIGFLLLMFGRRPQFLKSASKLRWQ
jgi:hypothetical protein